jgi:hypothetical protein
VKRWLPYLGLALGLALVAFSLFFGTSDEERIRGRLQELEDVVAMSDSRENVVFRATRIRKAFGEIFTKDAVFSVPELDTAESARARLIELAASVPHYFSTARLDLDGLQIRLDASKEHAVAIGDAKLLGTRTEGTREQDLRKTSIRLDKVSGEWRIVNVAVSPPQHESD